MVKKINTFVSFYRKKGLVKDNGRNLSPYPASILEALREKGCLYPSPKTVWIEINSKRIAVDYEAKEKNAQKARVNNAKVVEEHRPQNISNATNSYIANSIGNQTSNANPRQYFPEKMTRLQKKKMRKLMRNQQLIANKQSITNNTMSQISSADSNSAKGNSIPMQQPGPSKDKEYLQNQSVQNSNGIRTASQSNINQNILKQNAVIEISSEESLPDSETNCIASNNIARNDSIGLTLQSYMTTLNNSLSTGAQNLNPTNTANNLMQLPWEGNTVLSVANCRKKNSFSRKTKKLNKIRQNLKMIQQTAASSFK